MKIEVLYPEICNLYGDLQNITYIASSNDIEVVKTSLKDVPAFISEDISLVYMGTTSESGQELARDALKKYANELLKRIKNNKPVLFTGNALEILGDYIEDNGKKIEMLGLYPHYAIRNMKNRYNSLYLGKYNDMKIVGFKSQFSHSYGNSESTRLFKTIKGDGFNLSTLNEGFKDHKLYATYVIGPLLILNPDFAKHILKEIGVKNPKLNYEEIAYESYLQRLHDFEEPTRNYRYS